MIYIHIEACFEGGHYHQVGSGRVSQWLTASQGNKNGHTGTEKGFCVAGCIIINSGIV